VAKENADRMLALASSLGVAVRPHVKTHKTEAVALLQTGGAKRGITVSTLAEAEFYADRGWDDILYAVPLTPDKIASAAKLTAQLGRFIVCVDNKAHVDAILAHGPVASTTSDDDDNEEVEGQEAGTVYKPWQVALMVDCGYHREGVDPFDPSALKQALGLVQRLDGGHTDDDERGGVVPTSLFHGLYTHGGHSYDAAAGDVAAVRACSAQERDAVVYLAQELRKAKQEWGPMTKVATTTTTAAVASWPGMVSVGSTPTCALPPLNGLGGVTEIHPGNYVFYDTAMFTLGACSRSPLTLRTTRAEQEEERADAGGRASSSLSSSSAMKEGSLDDIAVRVLTRVVGHYPKSNTLLVDMGWTAQGGGQGKDLNYGAFTHIVGEDVGPTSGKVEELCRTGAAPLGLKVACLKQECGEVTSTDGSPLDFSRFPVGCILAFAPYHSCATGHNHPSLLVLEGDQVVDELEVAKGW
jgi:D-serine deaminase-like pyridoxal phosphate-dependent protein